ncbi:MAG: hypothetical protein JWR42_356 [Marmoricola sp.]|nr:hypothetical protein [Marmoricola sp.]
MSQSQPQGAPQPPRGGRYQRSNGGLLAAMLVTVLLVVGFVAFRGIFRDNAATPVRAVDYRVMLKAGVADDKLAMLAPPRLPIGWQATSATYATGTSPTWHVGILTTKQKFIGIDESRSSVSDLVTQYVDPNATRGKDLRLAGETWQVYTDAGGDYGLARTLTGPGPNRVQEAVLVAGSAPDAEIRDLVSQTKVNAR